MGPFDNYKENLVDTVTVADENTVDRLEDTVSDGGCVSGVVDDNAGVALRKDLLCSERRVDCLSGNSCWNYRCSDDMDRTNQYHPPFRNYPVGDGVGFTDSKNYEEMRGNGEVNGLSYGAVGEMEKGEFGASSLCLNDSDIGNCFISDVGLDNPSPGGETLTTSSPGSSGVTCILLNEQKETVLTGLYSQTYMTDCLDDRYLASSQEDDEERGRDSTGVSPDLPTGRNLDGSRQGSPEISFQNPVEGSVAPLPLLFGATGIGCSNYLSISDKCERFGVSALTCCSSTVDGYTELMSNDSRNDFKHGTLFESNNAEIGPSSSSVISRGRKSKLLTRTGRAAKQCRQTVISSSCLSNNLGTTSNVKRGKRSIFCKPARLNTWGELGSLVQMFDQNAGISSFNLRSSCHEAGLLGSESKLIKNQGSVKKKGNFGRGRCEKAGKSECFKGSKRSASTIRRRSKVKLEGWGARKGRRSLKVDPLAGQALKPLDAGSLCSLAENPNRADTGSNSNPKIGCIHTAIDSWVHETNCLLNSEITQPDRKAVHKLEAEWFGDGRRDQLVLSEPAGKFRLPLDVNSGRPILSPDVSVLDPQHVDKDMDSTVTVDKLTEYALGDFQGVSPQIEIKISKEAIVNMHSEPGLFPALEGFNPIPEKGTIISEVAISTGQKSKAKKGRKNGKVKGDPYLLAGPFPMEHNLLKSGSLNKARKLTKNRAVKSGRSRNGPKAVSRCSSLKASGLKGFSMEISVPDIAEVMVSRENVKLETATENLALSVQDTIGIEQSGAPISEGSLPIGKSKGHKLSKKSRIAARKNRSLDRDSAKSRKVSARGKKNEIKDNAQNYLMLQAAGGFNDGEEVACGDTSGSFMVAVGDDLAADNSSKGLEVQCLPPRAAWVLCDDCQKWRCIPAELADVIEETNCKWTCKDNTDKAYADCLIPQEKSNAEINAELNISDEDSPSAQPYFKGSETMQSTASQQASWTLIKSNLFLYRSRRTQTIDEIMVCQCKPPQDGHMGCGDECLNRMLNIECVQGTCPCGDLCSNQQFQRQKYANFKWFRCGKKGYGLQLQENVSRGAFLIEYVGEVLDLHAYEARQQQYASRGQKHFYFMTLNGNEVIDACAKGNLGRFINHSCDPNCRTEKWMVNGQVCIGLFALRDIKKGEEVTFDYNYVRVFGAAAKKCVCGSSGCRGYIGGDPSNTEVIKVDSDDEYPEPIMIHEDGRIERFEEEEILDSRLPNVVNVPVGAHFEDQKIPDNRLQDVVLHGVHFVEATIPEISVSAITIPQGVDLEERIPDTLSADAFALPQMDISQTTQLKSSPSSNSVQDNVKIPKMCPSHMKSSCISSSFKNGRYITSRIKATKPKKLVASSESGHTEGVDVKLNEVKSTKLKRMVPGAERSRVEGVEEKLNEVLDSDGGISKRKDATKGYLKLLLVTAASGDNVKGEAFQSTRDLSIVLDALLKTKSRMVLVDIVNKNGLQMLHNIMKQNHRNFNKIPIIRKLLKVLEFLAVKEILTLEHINAPPPCAGVESFRDSIINLTRHKDMQVHHIARSFRDKWVPRTLRKVNLSDRDDVEFSHRSGHWKRFPASTLGHRQGPNEWHTNTINCATTTPIYTDSPTSQTSPSPLQLGSSDVSTTDGYPTTLTKQRKRKSRWDQPTEMDSGAESQPAQNTHRLIETNATLQGLNTSQVEPSLQKSKVYEVAQNQITAIQRDENYCTACDDNQSFRVAIQPLGASSQPSPNNHLSSNSPFLNPSNNNRRPYYPNPTCREVVMGQPQAKFLPNLPVSYGIPLPLVQRLGTFHQEDGGEGASCAGWAIAPAVPFHPFPPLPPCPPPSLQPCAHHITKPSERSLAEEVQGDNSTRNHHAESTMPTTSGAKPSEDMVFNRIRSPQSHERGRWSSGGLGRRFFRQQKGNFQGYPKCPPWVCQRNGWVSKGNWKHSGFSRVGNVMDEVGSMGQGKPSFRRTCGAGSCPLEDKGGKNGCNYYQHPPFDQQKHRKSYS